MKNLITLLLLALVSFAASAQSYPRGDVNQDGEVSIADVTTLIDNLLNDVAYGDVDLDGEVSITDLTCLIDYLLRGSWSGPEPITFTVDGVTFTMVEVEGGTFTMGATAEQGSDAWSEEKPAHQVTLSSFCIGQTEVTQALWLAVMDSNPSYFTGDLNRPVEYMSWEACQTFIARLNQLTGQQFRLPTEAEWEYAARGGNLSRGYKYAGSNTIDDVAWYIVNAYNVGSSSPDYGTHAVATRPTNELGLYDMSGNVWEWCQDWFSSSYYYHSPAVNPTGPASGSNRVFRGGGWSDYASNCRVSSRYFGNPSSSRINLGLRLAL